MAWKTKERIRQDAICVTMTYDYEDLCELLEQLLILKDIFETDPLRGPQEAA
jgi:hypothetical protein